MLKKPQQPTQQENLVKQQKINPKKILEQRRSIVDTIPEELESKGVIFFKPVEMDGTLDIDEEYLSIPKDLTDLPSRELGKYLNAFTQKLVYYRTLIGWQELVVESSKREYYDISTPYYEELTAQKLSETAKDRITNNHEDVKPLFIKYKDEKKKLELLGYAVDSINDAIFSVSREVSRRGADFNVEGRNDNVQGR